VVAIVVLVLVGNVLVVDDVLLGGTVLVVDDVLLEVDVLLAHELAAPGPSTTNAATNAPTTALPSARRDRLRLIPR
jgi:hypothetical protein